MPVLTFLRDSVEWEWTISTNVLIIVHPYYTELILLRRCNFAEDILIHFCLK